MADLVARVALGFTELQGPGDGELLVLGHSLGTSAELWRDALPALRQQFRVVLWELPGHGVTPPARSAFEVEDLTDSLVAHLTRNRIGAFHYAGASIGGCVGLDLCVRHPELVKTVAVISTGARVDDPALFRTRAASARRDGMHAFADAFRDRWFTPDAAPATVERVLGILRGTDAESYALASEALAPFDVSGRLAEIAASMLAIGGRDDQNVPIATSEQLARAVPRGASTIIEHSSHCLVAEQPIVVARELIGFATA